MGPRILVAEQGTHGDLNPHIAIALALRARGAHPVMAVPEDHLAKCRAAGLEAHAVRPGLAEIAAAHGFDAGGFFAELGRDPHFMLRQMIESAGDGTLEHIEGLCGKVDAVVASAILPAALFLAERRGLPYFEVNLQPYGVFSAHNPPVWRVGPKFAKAPVGRLGLMWNRALFNLARLEMRRRHGRAMNAVRRAAGLPASRRAPLFDREIAPERILAMYPALLSPPQPDWPEAVRVCGFPFFESLTGKAERPDPELAAFLSAGPAPLVFSLGTAAPAMETGFDENSVAAARALGQRVVLLTDKATVAPSSDVFVASYVPHSQVFPRARAIVTHGGIGSVGQALRAGRPQLVVPHFGDQLDNGRRIERLGAGLCLPIERYTAETARAHLERLLNEDRLARAASEIGKALDRQPDGAAVAADHVLDALGIEAPARTAQVAAS